VQLQQVLLNLVVNGCDAMADVEAVGRSLLVRTELADEKEVRVSVVDQGCEIPPEKIKRIFEPFFTTKGFTFEWRYSFFIRRLTALSTRGMRSPSSFR
jgi:signal transduction histidine kinase